MHVQASAASAPASEGAEASAAEEASCATEVSDDASFPSPGAVNSSTWSEQPWSAAPNATGVITRLSARIVPMILAAERMRVERRWRLQRQREEARSKESMIAVRRIHGAGARPSPEP
jgi:hypothetical protein